MESHYEGRKLFLAFCINSSIIKIPQIKIFS
jgi:hypothetical protein